MPTIKEQLLNDLKAAMKAKDELGLLVLRGLNSAIKNKEISLRDADSVALDDAQILDVIVSEVKKRNDSVASYKEGGRADLVDKEMAEIRILEKYLPAQLSDEEIEKEVKAIIEGIGAGADFGKTMGQVMAKLKGKADGNKINAAVKKILGK